MPILVSSLISSIRSVGLDASPDSDYYNDQEDIIPAINLSIRWLVSLIDFSRQKNKRTDEVLRELKISRVFQLDEKSRFEFTDSIWTLDAIMPLPSTSVIAGATPVVQSDTRVSVERTDLIHNYSNYHAGRLTIEEWAIGKNNPFMPGNMVGDCYVDIENGSNKNIEFAYLDSYDYYGQTPNNLTKKFSCEVRPFIPLKLCTVFYVKSPTLVTAPNQNIEFSQNMFSLIYDKALQFISYNQGDQTTIWSITDVDVQRLLSSITK